MLWEAAVGWVHNQPYLMLHGVFLTDPVCIGGLIEKNYHIGCSPWVPHSKRRRSTAIIFTTSEIKKSTQERFHISRNSRRRLLEKKWNLVFGVSRLFFHSGALILSGYQRMSLPDELLLEIFSQVTNWELPYPRKVRPQQVAGSSKRNLAPTTKFLWIYARTSLSIVSLFISHAEQMHIISVLCANTGPTSPIAWRLPWRRWSSTQMILYGTTPTKESKTCQIPHLRSIPMWRLRLSLVSHFHI